MEGGGFGKIPRGQGGLGNVEGTTIPTTFASEKKKRGLSVIGKSTGKRKQR